MSSIALLVGRRFHSFASQCRIIHEAKLIKNINQYSSARPFLTPILQHQCCRYSSQFAAQSIKFRANSPYKLLIWCESRPYSQRSNASSVQPGGKGKNTTTLIYVIALAIAVVGLSYAAVPLYRVFCQASGFGGTTTRVVDPEKIASMQTVPDRPLTIRFNADTGATMRWNFRPKQKEIQLIPGETALAFYTAKNPTDEPIIGISTYNVIPFEAGLYFNKVQCFCFEEQRLNPHEEVDMPVFFYIDPEIMQDPALARIDTITLSYTFFESKDFDQNNIPSQ